MSIHGEFTLTLFIVISAFQNFSIRFVSSLALHPTEGKLYFTHWLGDAKGKIYSAWLDGTHKTVLAETVKDMPMSWPLSLSIDRRGKKLYWCDVKTYSIERMNLDGSQRVVLFKDAQYHPLSMAFHNGVVYWVDKRNGTIQRFSVNSNTFRTPLKGR